MTICNRVCWLKAVSVAAGLVATTFLLVAILIATWINISDVKIENWQNYQPKAFPQDVPTNSRLIQTPPPEESSGEGDELLVYGKMTTWPGFIDTSTAIPSKDYRILQRSINVGLWKMCMTKYLMEWPQKGSVVLAEDGIWNGTECWVINPFRYDVLPADDAVKRTTPIIRIIQAQHFNLPLVTSLGLIVVAVLVTSGGMAKNNAVILAGAALYEFSCLTLAVSLIWFFPLMYYAEAPSYPSYWPYYGPEEIIVGYKDIQLWYSFGPALCYCFGAFLFMNIAAATGVSTYQLTATKASHHRLIRREREAVRKANRQWLVTRL